ncbi:MAG: iron-sulfur cluster assembly accessory protein [Capsulimonadaceae bacterium]|nr:iron-sulfur cluster assembly accessory protein [Capsulimonadaceae bacterium]
MATIAEPTEFLATPVDPAITLTASAARQVQRTLARKGDPNAFLRLGVKGGGCSGYSYVMEADTETDEDDLTWVTAEGIRVVIDPKSLSLLSGMTVDYTVKNLMEGGFVYQNPNAGRSCGCGTSFSPA